MLALRLFRTSNYGLSEICIDHFICNSTVPNGRVSFKRQLIKQFPEWKKLAKGLTRLHVSSKGKIEDDGIGMLQVIDCCSCKSCSVAVSEAKVIRIVALL